MSEQVRFLQQDESSKGGRKVTVLEALAEETNAVGLSRSNQSTQAAGDADDQ